MQTSFSPSEIIAAIAWSEAANIADSHDWGVVASEMAKRCEPDQPQDLASSIRSAILAGLRSASGDHVWGDIGHPTHCEMGIAEILGSEAIYWQATNAGQTWSADQPDNWDDDVARLGCEDT